MISKGMRAHTLRHLRAPVPLHFPESAEMPESMAHLLVRTFLFQLLRHALGPSHSVGSEQFVYWAPTNPRRCLAPDVFVKLGVGSSLFGTWKSWLHGAPDLAVDIVSPSDGEGLEWDEKLARYGELGVAELVRFDPEAAEGGRLRVWDRMEEDLVEREVLGDTTPCLVLGWTWVVSGVAGVPVGLRLEAADGGLVLTREEELEAEVARLRAAAAP
jgi:Uma2 family endonuclease